jgi:uncharacterized membrane protein
MDPGSPQQPSNTMGLASMIVGIVSIPLACLCGLGLLGGIVAIVLGFLGKGKADRGEATNRGQALVGIITGAVALGLGVLWIILSVVLNVTNFGVSPNL